MFARAAAPSSRVLALSALAASGCVWFEKFDDSDACFSIDATVPEATARKLCAYLDTQVPALRSEKLQRASSHEKVKLIVRVENAPEPTFPARDRDARLHREYYWLSAGFHGPEKILKSYRYLVHRDVNEVLFYDDPTDTFLKVSQ